MTSFFVQVSWVDLSAFIVLLVCFAFYGPLSRNFFGDNITTRMLKWRKIWVKQMLWRQERITDVTIVRGLIANVSFFATTTVFVISGLIALLGSSASIAEMLNRLQHFETVTEETVIIKLCALLAIAIVAFFKFGWSLSLHANALLMVGSAPEPDLRESEEAQYVIQKLAEMSALASLHFHGGVRAYYFGFASLPWLISAWLFFPSLIFLIIVSIRREYLSKAFRAALPPKM